MTSSETFFNTPGAVENFLDWANGLDDGDRGFAPSATCATGIEVTGTEETAKALALYIKNVPEIVQDELALYAEKILQASLREVPWDTTHLQQTGTVEQDPDDPGALRIGYNTPYAARQHEDMTLHHPKPGTKAKYLEDPAMRIEPEIAGGIVDRIDSYFSAGVPSMTGLSASNRASMGNLLGRFG